MVSPMYSHSGRSFARDDKDTEGKGYGRKQMAARNKLHRGITLIRKDADLLNGVLLCE